MNEQKTVTFSVKSVWNWIEKIMWTILTVYCPYKLLSKVMYQKINFHPNYYFGESSFSFQKYLVDYCYNYSPYFIIANFVALTLIASHIVNTEKSAKFAKILFFINIAVIILVGILNKLYVGN